jgi:hypothetical protein
MLQQGRHCPTFKTPTDNRIPAERECSNARMDYYAFTLLAT